MRNSPLVLFLVSVVAAGASSVFTTGDIPCPWHFDRSFGAAVSDAPLKLQSEGGNPVQETTSTASGAFVFSAISSGSYVITVPAVNGFAQRSVAIHVPLHGSSLVIRLQTDTVVQTVNVEGKALSTDSAANKDAVAYRANDLRSVPIFDQDLVGALTPFLVECPIPPCNRW